MGRTPESIPQSSGKIAVALLSDTVGLDAGTERQVVETAKRLDKDRFDVHVVCLEDSPQLRSLASPVHTAVFPTASVNSPAGPAAGAGVPQICRRARPANPARLHEQDQPVRGAVGAGHGAHRHHQPAEHRLLVHAFAAPDVSRDESAGRRHHGEFARG